MKLEVATETHLPQLMQWFPDQRSCLVWAGPEFRHPFTERTFRDDVRLELPSYVLVGADGELLGFGQYYLRVGRCHLARLAIAPPFRGRGFGTHLIHELCRRGCSTLSVDHLSLFVFPDNAPAARLYRRMGFASTPYPEKMPQGAEYIYMVAPPEVIGAWNPAPQGADNNARLG